MSKNYYVYILTNNTNTVLYIGVTNDLTRRAWEHREKKSKGFTEKYNVRKLVYFEQTESVEAALIREKQLKNWKRAWKEKLVEEMNPDWKDLYKQF